MNFSNNLKKCRKRAKMTQSDLANLIGGADSTISNYEKGVSYPEFLTLLKLKELFKVDLETLVYGEISDKLEIPNNTNIEIRELKESSTMYNTEKLLRIELIENERQLYERLLKEKDVVIELLRSQLNNSK